MAARAVQALPLVEWAVASRPLPGQTRSGDCHLVAPFPGGLLAAALDGLGHGDEAAGASAAAAAILGRFASDNPSSLIRRCHEELRRTRGAVISLATLDASRGCITWLGVGNVRGVLLRAGDPPRAKETLLPRSGVVGHQLPSLRPVTLPLAAGDTLVLATDGIRDAFSEGLTREGSPQELADAVLARHRKDTDDALVLVVRYGQPAR